MRANTTYLKKKTFYAVGKYSHQCEHTAELQISMPFVLTEEVYAFTNICTVLSPYLGTYLCIYTKLDIYDHKHANVFQAVKNVNTNPFWHLGD